MRARDTENETDDLCFHKGSNREDAPASEVKRFRFWGKQHRQILYIPDENWWAWEEQMGNLEEHNLGNMKNLKSYLS